jgi:ferredoxin-NADP reductase
MTKRLLIASRVRAIEDVAVGIRRFTVVPEHRPRYPRATPGSHVTVRHRTGMLRSYSLCSDASRDDYYQFAVQREDAGRGGSTLFHNDMAVGDPLHVSYPVESLLLEEADSYVFVAGGIGITPFLPLAIEADRLGRPAELHYAVRTREQLAFLSEFESIPKLTIHLYVSSEGSRVDVATLVETLGDRAHLLSCGPERLLSAISSAAAARPEAADRIHLESFSGMDPEEASSGDPFKVHLRLSRIDVDVPANKSLLRSLIDAGVDVDSSCEGGICGACRVTLVSGDAIHRDICLTETSRLDPIITCVSRGNGVLTLQL